MPQFISEMCHRCPQSYSKCQIFYVLGTALVECYNTGVLHNAHVTAVTVPFQGQTAAQG